ncbi:hypothetical protein IB223_03965 [Pseudoxanthomonas sp. PXM03]|uniref:DUF6869 domain-containing protein n=1 Tax=Pseudoxanthomonas sp. PXM03 TaxID=2769284 RepID=UPI00177E47CD|nr:hypothetical protein [Pseudoxanthomonas sp. PXM03]MBD9435242.1 hypothetical protein [Pseudoxanthomonas sp. PXM03]
MIHAGVVQMEVPSPEDVASRWIEKWNVDVREHTGESDGYDLDVELPFQHPRLCLDAILLVLPRIPSDSADRHFQVLAAGPLEDLLVHHGQAMIDEIDVLARRSPSFRMLLNGVWTSRIDSAVVERLAKYRSAQW